MLPVYSGIEFLIMHTVALNVYVCMYVCMYVCRSLHSRHLCLDLVLERQASTSEFTYVSFATDSTDQKQK